LKQRAQAVYIIEALKQRNLTLWEAFSAFDFDNNGILAPSEFYGALRFLGVPNLTPEDVVDFIEAADTNNDGMVDYKEYMDMLSFGEAEGAEGGDAGTSSEEQKASGAGAGAGAGADSSGGEGEGEGAVAVERVPMAKVEPYGAEVLREIMVQRRQQEQVRIREERLRKQAYHDALDVKVFEEELDASKLRKGGANPAVMRIVEGSPTATSTAAATATAATAVEGEGSSEAPPVQCGICVTDFRFSTNQNPLRFAATGKSSFIPINFGTAVDGPVKPMRCGKNHVLAEFNYYWMDCTKCSQRSTNWACWPCYVFFCTNCYDADRRGKELERRDPSKHPTFLRCQNACSFSLQVPVAGGACPVTGKYTLSMEVRFEKLPKKGSMQSLLRFSLPDMAQARKLHRTSVYLNGDGIVVGRPLETGGGVEVVKPDGEEAEKKKKKEEEEEAAKKKKKEEEEKEKEKASAESKDGEEAAAAAAATETEEEKAAREEAAEKEAARLARIKAKPARSGVVRVRPGQWAIISVSVDPEAGTLASYVNGEVGALAALLLWICIYIYISVYLYTCLCYIARVYCSQL
jgi:hypothetical protein